MKEKWSDLSDDDLVKRASRGANRAFEQLVVRYQDRIYNLMLRLTGSTQDAEDLTQETFLKAYRALGSLRQGSVFYTWLFRIAVNERYSDCRRQARRQQTEGVSLNAFPVSGHGSEQAEWCNQVAASADDPAQLFEQRQLRQRVHRGLVELEEDLRLVILLRDSEGLDYGTIANAVDAPVSVVKSKLYRARRQLARILKDLNPKRPSTRRLNHPSNV